MAQQPDTDRDAAAWLRATRLVAGVREDARRVRTAVSLAAFENVLSRTARALLADDLAERYLIGRVEDRMMRHPWGHGGLLCTGYPGVDLLELEAVGAAKELFGAAWVDFRPLSGLHATICALSVLTEPGQTVWSVSPDNGGHFATRPLLARLGRRSAFLPWSDGTVDVAALRAAWAQAPGALVILDHSSPLRPVPVAQIREVVGADTTLIYDASHTLGLIAGGRFQDPLREGCDVLQANTHKSFPGAHKGVLMFADAERGRQVSAQLGQALVSSQQTGASLANYVTTLEMHAYAGRYVDQMLRNRQALAEALTGLGARVRTCGPDGGWGDSHLLLVESLAGRDGYALAEDLVLAGVGLNARPVDGTVVLRLGVQEVTRRGLAEPEMALLAQLMHRAATEGPTPATAAAVAELSGAYGEVCYSFDQPPVDDGYALPELSAVPTLAGPR